MRLEYRPVSITENLVTQQIDNEWLVYDARTGRAVQLNAAAAQVWQACDGQRTVAEIARQIKGVDNAAVSVDVVWLALELLEREGLVVPVSESVAAPQISRRQVAKRVGAAALMVLPMVVAMNVTVSAQGSVPSACLTCINQSNNQLNCGVCANITGTCYNNNGCSNGGSNTQLICGQCANYNFNAGQVDPNNTYQNTWKYVAQG
jgi:hypothetical protein